jgi:uncharacterized protein (TIGR02171 family)
MSPRVLLTLLAAGLLALSCDNPDRVETLPPDPLHRGMVLIAATGHTLQMGSRDSLAGADEQPPMGSLFTYDYWLDRTEVTLGAYDSAMGRLPAEYHGAAVDPRLPVANVTWCDAVLYCNRRSRAAGLDTVYRYDRIDSTASGSVYRLAGLGARLGVEGYRLPTEAEWEYAAHGGSSTVFAWGDSADPAQAMLCAWYLDNADRRAHAVGLLRPNSYGLYDMAGNVMEWVHDWKAPYRDTTVQDYAGPLSSQSDERPVKGGSYAHGLTQLRPACRSDVYQSLSSTTAPYIGLRCALGVVPDPSSLALLPPDSSDTAGAWLADFTTKAATPTGRTKLVFVNRRGESRTLCFVDFWAPQPRITEYADQKDVYAPTISPDGNYVAFGTAGEGRPDGSVVYIRRLDQSGSGLVQLADAPAFLPRWWVDPASGDTFIVYTNSSVVNSSASWASTLTKRQRVSGGAFAGAPEVIESRGSFHGGLSADGRYLATGLPWLLMKSLTDNTVRTLFTAPQNGKAAPDTSQVCNVSISPSTAHPDEALFLDFGSYGHVSSLTGDVYDVHQYLFRSRYSGDVVAWYRTPAGYAAWDHPEWSTVYECAAAGVQDSRGLHPAIYAVNLRDTTYARLVEGEDLWQPYLWVDPTVHAEDARFALDSLGYYNEPPAHGFQADLAAKMPRFWSIADSVDVLFAGSSHVLAAVAPPLFTGLSVYNLGVAGIGLLGSVRLVQDYVLPHCPAVKLVGMSLMPGWMNDSLGDTRWVEGTQNTRGYVYDRNHGFWRDSLPPLFVQHVAKAPNPPDNTLPDDRGWYRFPTLGWPAPLFAGSENWTVDDTNYIRNFRTLADLADTLANRRIHLLLIAFPQHPIYRNYVVDSVRWYGRYGPSYETAQAMWVQLRNLEAANPYFHFYDAHLFGMHDYTPADAYDADHLSAHGAEKMTPRLDSLVHQILGM